MPAVPGGSNRRPGHAPPVSGGLKASLAALVDGGDALHFDHDPTGQTRRLNGGAGRLVGAEELGVDRVEAREVIHVAEEAGRLDHTVERTSGGFKDRLEIGQHLARFGLDGIAHHVPGGAVHAALAGDKDEVAFPYGATRALTQAQEILGEFAGTLVTDGYGVYSRYTSKVTGVSHATCWAHTRRKFIEAENLEPRRCQKALEYIRVLYEIEDSIRECESEDILRARRERSLPIVEEFFDWLGMELTDLTILPSSPFSKAASYAIERKDSLSVYLSDPAVPIDTNHLERALRPIPMGRKNWL